ncbi:glycoside hydrolase family 13 protein [Weissella confusa]|uniref:glycoside hydrolase family 13 protein n=1 Tax=Weissella confusa TaxID=1583 RepID=UPI0002465C74|nr:glycoside hydrolase family 13 protein [Weissella confusa]MBJ7616400.1 alpha-glycosidase [Weissella confusa]MBJ7626324.1 alpha-glycosidase [Weissella confusa]MBJ7672878.1 alpha-glycosidase [Weissella confusa]MBJ7691222.1 alpha-glycosidase [Weissella confusa]MBJ7701431.1 alpha-glycosidase [Weissella confusa]
MNLAGIMHRPDSEMAYVVNEQTVNIRLRTAKDDIVNVELLAGDPYSLRSLPTDEKFYQVPKQMTKIMSDGISDFWQVTVTEPKRRLAYAFLVTDMLGIQKIHSDKGFFKVADADLMDMNFYFRMPFFQTIDQYNAPKWVTDTVWYQIFPERFANGDVSNDPTGTKSWNSTDHPGREDFYGGDLQGILDHLDHLQDLGVSGIYLNPIFQAPSNHKYDTQDYMTVDPHFGDAKLFKQLVQAAHERGIRVMLDAVFNHIGDKSMQWQDVLKNGQASPYANWFHIRKFPATYTPTDNFEFAADATYDTFDYTPHMPKLNTSNPEVVDYLLNIATYWVKEFDIDAWRLDVANEIDHHFWRKFHDAMMALKPDFYILGEIWHTSQSWLVGDEFTAIMNYSYTGAILQYFLENESADTLVQKMSHQLMLYRDATNRMMFNTLDSHDTPRLMTLAHEDKQLAKSILAFTFMQPGVPSIYYGTEYGMTGENDPDDRKPMVWQPELQDHDLYDFMQKLVQVRRQNIAKLSDDKITFDVIGDRQIRLTREDNQTRIVGVFNNGTADLTVEQPATILLKTNQSETQLAPNDFIIWTEPVR